jgi:hypothetical protein
MRATIIFGAEPEQECHQNKDRHSLFRRSENESLPETIKFKALALFQFQPDLT